MAIFGGNLQISNFNIEKNNAMYEHLLKDREWEDNWGDLGPRVQGSIRVRERVGPFYIHPDAIARIHAGTITAQQIRAGEERTFTMTAYDLRGDADGDI